MAEDGTVLSREVFLAEVPAAAQTRIRTQIGSAKLVEIYWTFDTGQISYEVEVERNGQRQSFGVAPDGKLMSVQIGLADAPVAVQKAIQARIGTGTLADIYWAMEDDEVAYVVKVMRQGKEESFSVSVDGEFLSSTVMLSETPPAVEKTIKQQLGTGRLGEIERSVEAGEVSYDVKTFRNGHRRSFSVSADGKITSLQVLLAETPAEVQKTIKEQTGAGVILRIDRTSEGSETAFEIEAKKEGKKFSFSVGPDGKLQEAK